MVKYDSQKIDYQLHIDTGYYNTLNIEGFSRMMNDPSYCYKFYWLEAIVKLISEDKKEATYDEIINEMIANAWYSVAEFHIHLSGIWACASILHVKKVELPDIIRKMGIATKDNGIIYVSFKYGDYEGERNGRYFTDMTETSMVKLLENIPELKVEKQWITGDVRPDRGDERWLNMILRK